MIPLSQARLPVLLALGLLTGPGVAAPVLAPSPWRRLQLPRARNATLLADLRRAVRARWRKRLLEFDVELIEPRVLTNGTDFHLVADGGHVNVHRGTIGDLPVRARIDFGPVALDYPALGIGKLKIIDEVHIRPHLTITRENVATLLAKGKFVDVDLDFDVATRQLTLKAARPIRLLFLRLRPRLMAQVRCSVAGTKVRLDQPRLRISALPRFVARIVERRVLDKLNVELDLAKDFGKLRRHGVRMPGGRLDLYGRDGEHLLHWQAPGDPEIVPGANHRHMDGWSESEPPSSSLESKSPRPNGRGDL